MLTELNLVNLPTVLRPHGALSCCWCCVHLGELWAMPGQGATPQRPLSAVQHLHVAIGRLDRAKEFQTLMEFSFGLHFFFSGRTFAADLVLF